jgi:cytochrome c oxidase subunit I+III
VSRPTIDVSRLPGVAFGHRSIVWWGTMGIIAIEGTMFAMVAVAYLYLKGRAPHWPNGFFPPDVFWGTVNTVVLLASAVPNQLTKRAAERFDFRWTRIWLVVALVFALAFNVIRIFEFRSLNVWFDSNAYGSITWVLLGFHTVHILTDFADSLVLCGVLFIGPVRESHLVDVSENSLYWYFVVLAWLPIYGLIYWAPRLA